MSGGHAAATDHGHSSHKSIDYKTAYQEIKSILHPNYAHDMRTQYQQHSLDIIAESGKDGAKIPKSAKGKVEHAQKYSKAMIGKALGVNIDKGDDEFAALLYQRAFIFAVSSATQDRNIQTYDQALSKMKDRNFNYKAFLDALPNVYAEQHTQLKKESAFQDLYASADEMGFTKDDAQKGLFSQWKGDKGDKLIEGKYKGEIHHRNIEDIIEATIAAEKVQIDAAGVKEDEAGSNLLSFDKLRKKKGGGSHGEAAHH